MRNRGFILLEIVGTLFVISLLLITVVTVLHITLSGEYRIREDVEVYRAERSAMLAIKKEIAWQTQVLKIKNVGADTIIECQEAGDARVVNFHVVYPSSEDEGNLYRGIRVGTSNVGVNPLLSTGISVTKWKINKLDNRTLKIQLSLRNSQSKRERKFIEIIRLCNGQIEE